MGKGLKTLCSLTEHTAEHTHICTHTLLSHIGTPKRLFEPMTKRKFCKYSPIILRETMGIEKYNEVEVFKAVLWKQLSGVFLLT